MQEFARQGRSILAALYTYRSTAKGHLQVRCYMSCFGTRNRVRSLGNVTQSLSHDSGLNSALQHPDTYKAAIALATSAQQFCTETGEALIMIFVGMVAPDGINVNSSQVLLR